MKKFTFFALTLGILAITSCKKAVIDMNANNNNSSGSSAGNGNNNSNGSNNNNNFNWTGTAPFSAKINGVAFDTDPNTSWPYNIVVKSTVRYRDMADTSSLLLDFPTDAVPGSIYSSLMTYTWPNIAYHGSGKVKIIANSSTEVEGYFYGTVSGNNTTFQITEGYFKTPKS